MSVCIINTSIYCEILNVPNMASRRDQTLRQLKEKIQGREQLLLPMTTILETGNHIGQNGDGVLRRAAALRFVERTSQALRGETPFQTTPMVDKEQLIAMLAEFPNWAGRNDARGKGSGLGDLTIHGEWNQLCKRMPERRIYIWSLDDQLAAYDHLP